MYNAYYLCVLDEIRIFNTTVQVNDKSRNLFYICEPTMTKDHILMKSSLENQRLELMASQAKASQSILYHTPYILIVLS